MENTSSSKEETKKIYEQSKQWEDTSIDVNAIRNMEHKPLQFTINELLPQGLFLFSGSPKVGKSWLALDMGIAVATGGDLWGYEAEQAGVLYYALEDNFRRINDRINMLDGQNKDMINFRVKLSAPGLHDGLIEEVNNHMKKYPNTRFIILDTFENVRNGGRGSANMYVSDYNDMKTLRKITDSHAITLMLIHHNRKGKDIDDPTNNISGSTGLTGGTDGNWVLEKAKREEIHAKFLIDNRDTDKFYFDLKFEKYKWTFMGNHVGVDLVEKELCEAIYDWLVILNQNWQGTATELCNELTEIERNLNIKPISIGKTLRTIDHVLEKEYMIKTTFQKTNGVQKIIFKRTNI